MRRSLTILALLAFAAALAAPGATAGGEQAGAAKLKRCHTKPGFRTGPFFADQVKARGVSCTAARKQVKKWGNTNSCVYTDGPEDRTCRAGKYRCTYRQLRNFEGGRTTCKRGKKRAVGFRFGS